jgi:hypothetical protein
MSREIMQQALDAIKPMKDFRDDTPVQRAIAAIEAELAKPEQEAAIQHLWECLGRWSSYLVVNGTQANMAPPNWLLDAVIAATSPPRKPWVGLTNNELQEILDCGRGFWTNAAKIEQLLKNKNT